MVCYHIEPGRFLQNSRRDGGDPLELVTWCQVLLRLGGVVVVVDKVLVLHDGLRLLLFLCCAVFSAFLAGDEGRRLSTPADVSLVRLHVKFIALIHKFKF